MEFNFIESMNAKPKPFLKWAGGKTQLLETIHNSLPKDIYESKFTYVEPFVGSGAVLFSMINNFSTLDRVVINDINSDLINCYFTIKDNVTHLISELKELEFKYYTFKDKPEDRKEFYYLKRSEFNSRNCDIIIQSSLFIFLNRTCFNGLYRVNRNNNFNVPIGSYVTPQICDSKNLFSVSEALQKIDILCADFEQTLNYVSGNTFFYFDPPYKPLSQTSSFNSYAKDDFNDIQQIRLRDFCSKLNTNGYKWMLSNSDVKDNNPNNDFFDELYNQFNITRVRAKRSINANPDKRGELNELLITNYLNEQIVSVA